MGDSLADGQPETRVTRYWCAQTDSYSIDSDGFLSDPQELAPGGLSANPHAVPTETLAPHPCVVLLGEPGVGKSRTMEAFKPVSSDDIPVLRVDLADYGTEDRIIREVFEQEAIRRWAAGDSPLALVLDSFDEAQRRVPVLPLITRNYVRQYPCNRLYLRVACRTAEWPATLAKALDDCFSSPVRTVELLPLRRTDVPHLLPTNIHVGDFLDAVDRVHAGPLAARPLTLRMLIRSFLRDGTLPARGAELYERGSLTLCDEQSDERRDTRPTSRLTAFERLTVASRVAAFTSFGARTTVTLAPAGSPIDEHDLAFEAIVGGREPHDMGDVTVDVTSVKETLETGLFSGRGPGGIGWTHATFPDFLAARWLVSNGLSDEQLRSLMVATDGRLFPQVRRIGAWLVAMGPERFGWLTTLDPESFLSEVDLPDATAATYHRLMQHGRLWRGRDA